MSKRHCFFSVNLPYAIGYCMELYTELCIFQGRKIKEKSIGNWELNSHGTFPSSDVISGL